MQEISVEVEDETSSVSAPTQVTTDQYNRGHPDVIGSDDRTISGAEDNSSKSEAAVTERDRNDPQEPDLVMTQTSTSTSASQRQGPIMTGPRMIPERLPMARQSLGQVLRNQLEHRRRAAQQIQTPNTSPTSTSSTGHVVRDISDHDSLNVWTGDSPSQQYWNTWVEEVATPQINDNKPGMDNPCSWRCRN